MIDKGYCFEKNGDSFLVMGDAALYADASKVYLCQELTGAHRLLVFTEREIVNAPVYAGEEKTVMPVVTDKKKENENKDIKENTRVLQIQFNSWQFEDYEDTKLTLISTILNALSNDIADNKDIFEKADSFLGKIKYLKLGVVIVKNLAKKLIPEKVQQLLPTEEEWNEISKEDQDLLQEEVAQANASKFIERFREDYEKILVEADYRSVIVYIDDLDRCESNRIIQCLEAVKLFVNVKRTAFIIGADERIIENAIHERYKTPLEKTTISSPYSDYLEKLIQLPYKLPKLSFSEQETYVTLLLCSKLENENQFPVIHNRYL